MPNLSERAISEIRRLVSDLAAGNWSAIEADGRIGSMTQEELRGAVMEYGRTLVELPQSARDHVDVYPSTKDPCRFAVDVELFTIEEGRSDLTLSLTIVESEAGVSVSVDDLHVL